MRMRSRSEVGRQAKRVADGIKGLGLYVTCKKRDRIGTRELPIMDTAILTGDHAISYCVEAGICGLWHVGMVPPSVSRHTFGPREQDPLFFTALVYEISGKEIHLVRR